MNSKFLTIIFCVLLMAMGAKAWDTTPDAAGQHTQSGQYFLLYVMSDDLMG